MMGFVWRNITGIHFFFLVIREPLCLPGSVFACDTYVFEIPLYFLPILLFTGGVECSVTIVIGLEHFFVHRKVSHCLRPPLVGPSHAPMQLYP